MILKGLFEANDRRAILKAQTQLLDLGVDDVDLRRVSDESTSITAVGRYKVLKDGVTSEKEWKATLVAYHHESVSSIVYTLAHNAVNEFSASYSSSLLSWISSEKLLELFELCMEPQKTVRVVTSTSTAIELIRLGWKLFSDNDHYGEYIVYR